MAELHNTSSHVTLGKLHSWYDYESLLYLPIGLYKWELIDVEGALLKT